MECSVSDSAAGKATIGSLAFGNANNECKNIIGLLIARLASMEECIRYTADDGSCSPDMLGVVATRQLEMTQYFKCFNCGEQGYLMYECKKNKNNTEKGPMPPGICQRCGKNQHVMREWRAKKDKWGNTLPKTSRGALTGHNDRQGEFSLSEQLNVTD